MKIVDVALPAMGAYRLAFFDESFRLYEWLGERELDRLNGISHLGVASLGTAGLNHTRLEYVLLKCLVAHLIKKTSLDKDGFGLSNPVKISGYSKKISSGEELLKCWAILSNIGHTQHTYACENSILKELNGSRLLREHFVSLINDSDLQQWANDRIESYDQQSMHYIISAVRVSSELKSDPSLKILCHSLLKNLVLPTRVLMPNKYDERIKLERLRSLYRRIRLVAIVALDSYNSHHPIRIQIPGLLLNIRSLFSGYPGAGSFELLLRNTASWLADELYLHPATISARVDYGVRASRYLRRVGIRGPFKSDNTLKVVDRALRKGLSDTARGHVKSFARLSLPSDDYRLFGSSSINVLNSRLNRRCGSTDRVFFHIDINPYRAVYHIDILYRGKACDVNDVGRVCAKLWALFVVRLQVETLQWVKYNFGGRNEAMLRVLGRIRVRRHFDRAKKPFGALLWSIIEHVIGPDNSVYFPGFSGDDQDTPFKFNMSLPYGGSKNDATDYLAELLDKNPENWGAKRLHEIRLLKEEIPKRVNGVIAVCPYPVYIRDGIGNRIDEWDGVIISVEKEKVHVAILEAKYGGRPAQRAQEAFDQLEDTKEMISRNMDVRLTRAKIDRKGAKLTFSLGY